MIDLIRDNLDEIRALCEQHHVQRLEVFGSAATGEFREGESDADLLVFFEPVHWETRADSFFALLFALEDLLVIPVDLITQPPPERRNRSSGEASRKSGRCCLSEQTSKYLFDIA